MTSSCLAENPIMAKLGDKVKSESIKLLEPPLYDPDAKTPVDHEVRALALEWATELDLLEDDVTQCLFRLQQQALEKAAEIEEFSNSGKATLRFKYAGNFAEEENDASLRMVLPKVQISLSASNGMDLKDLISEGTGIPAGRMKLICYGAVIDDDELLDAQGLENGSQLMVLFAEGAEILLKELEEIETSPEYLGSYDRINNYLMLDNQFGWPMDIPEDDQRDLAVALALHKRGREKMKSNDFSKALIFLLKADSEFSECDTDLLDEVDKSYETIYLDIAWCYLNLNCITELPDAEERLEECEEALTESYGKDLEQIITLKESSGLEVAFLVRLQLLQAVAAYHFGHIEKSRFLLGKVEEALNCLKVRDEKLAALMSKGFLKRKCLMALRATDGDLIKSESWIKERFRIVKDTLSMELLRNQCKVLQLQLGTCADGCWVNVKTFLKLQEMGFTPELSAAALRRANNDGNEAIQLLRDDADAEASFLNQDRIEAEEDHFDLDPEQIQQVTESLLNKGLSISSSTTIIQDLEKSKKAWESWASDDIFLEERYIDLGFTAETQIMEKYKSLLLDIV